MASQKETDELYMGTAMLYAKLSKAKRAQVGSCLVTKNGVVLGGVNGTPAGLSNECEELKPQPFPHEPALVTKPEVIHSELNCILKAAREGVSCIGATMYVTLSPCVPCAAMMIQAGVKRLVYKDVYRDQGGTDLLQRAGIVVESYA
jgi:dCMP deaminase